MVDDSESYEILANNDYYLGVSNSVFIAYYSGENMEDYDAFSGLLIVQRIFRMLEQ